MFLRRRMCLTFVVGALVGGAACGNEDTGPAASFEELSLAVCAPNAGPFTVEIDNPFLPMVVGNQFVLEGDDEGTALRVTLTVTDELEEVAGVMTRVVEETELADGTLVEASRNFFAQAPDGTVCYFGEDVDIYEDGRVVDHQGAWRAGGDNLPGIMMPASPRLETKFQQESAPGTAEDWSAIMEVNQTVSVPAGVFEDVLRTVDWNPLDGQTSEDGDWKYYARDTGLIIDEFVKLVRVEQVVEQ